MESIEKQEKLERRVLATLCNDPSLIRELDPNIFIFTGENNRNIYKGLIYSYQENTKQLDLNKFINIIGTDNFKYYENVLNEFNGKADWNADISALEEAYKRRELMELLEELELEEIDYNEFMEATRRIECKTIQANEKELDVESVYNLITSDGELLEFKTFKDMQMKLQLTHKTLNVIGARPGVGKSAFALNLLNDLSQNSKYKCIYVNMEMNEKEIFERLVGINTREQIKKFKYADENGELSQTIKNCLQNIRRRNIYFIHGTMSIESIAKIIGKTKRMNKDKHLIVFIDYLSYITTKQKAPNERERLNNILHKLVSYTKDYDCTIFLLAQLNRNATSEIKPKMEELKDTGQIEQDAHTVLLLYELPQEQAERIKHNMSVNVAKNRTGECGKDIPFSFHKETQLFTE